VASQRQPIKVHIASSVHFPAKVWLDPIKLHFNRQGYLRSDPPLSPSARTTPLNHHCLLHAEPKSRTESRCSSFLQPYRIASNAVDGGVRVIAFSTNFQIRCGSVSADRAALFAIRSSVSQPYRVRYIRYKQTIGVRLNYYSSILIHNSNPPSL
jgi:hypothetical protein